MDTRGEGTRAIGLPYCLFAPALLLSDEVAMNAETTSTERSSGSSGHQPRRLFLVSREVEGIAAWQVRDAQVHIAARHQFDGAEQCGRFQYDHRRGGGCSCETEVLNGKLAVASCPVRARRGRGRDRVGGGGTGGIGPACCRRL